MEKFKEKILREYYSLPKAIKFFSQKHFGVDFPKKVNERMQPKRDEADAFHIICHVCLGYCGILPSEMIEVFHYNPSSMCKAVKYCDEKLQTSRSFVFKYERYVKFLKETLYVGEIVKSRKYE